MRQKFFNAAAGALLGLLASIYILQLLTHTVLVQKTTLRLVLTVSGLVCSSAFGAVMGLRRATWGVNSEGRYTTLLGSLRSMSFWKTRVEPEAVVYTFDARQNVLILIFLIVLALTVRDVLVRPYGQLINGLIFVLYTFGQASIVVDASRARSKRLIRTQEGKTEVWFRMS
jgi:hypothetical protein